jgi:hypothetical protein
MNDDNLICESCQRTGVAKETLPDLETFSVAIWPNVDRAKAEHQIFDAITPIKDANGGIWLEFNGGANPLCPACQEHDRADGILRDHNFATCDYVDCVDIRASIAARP